MKCYTQFIQIVILSLGLSVGGFFSSLRGATLTATPADNLNALVQQLNAGDTLALRGGTYSQSLIGKGVTAQNIPSGDSWASPVTIKSYPGETAILKAPAGNDWGVYLGYGTRYIVFEGLVIDGYNIRQTAFRAQGDGSNGSHHTRLRNCEIKNAGRGGNGSGVGTHGILGIGNGSELLSTKVYENGLSDFDHGLYASGNDILIDGCEFFRNSGWGIHKWDKGDRWTIRNTKSYDNATARPPTGRRGAGIGLYSGTGSVVQNCSVWGNHTGVVLQYGERGDTIENTKSCNNPGGNFILDQSQNTFRNNSETGCGSVSPPPPSNVDVSQTPTTSQPSGPSTSQVAAPFLIAGVIGVALLLGD